jgi:acetylornithine deacetylase/succinyl-diaminopimelate desuccinylase-like protein
VARYVAGHLRRSGLRPRFDADGNVIVEAGSGRRRLHINAHMDTVVPVSGWRGNPLRPRVSGTRLYGLGASDCKAGIAGLLWLAPRIRPRVRVLFSFTVCEEGVDLPWTNGSNRIARMGGDWAILCEPTCDSRGPLIGIGTQGHARARVVFRGKAAHSSVPEDGRNAIEAEARFCSRIKALNASFPRVHVAPGAVARSTVAPTIIHGGRLANVIPDECVVTVSRRFAPGHTVRTFRRELDRLLRRENATYGIATDGNGACADPGGKLMCAARASAGAIRVPARLRFARGRTDAVLFAARGMDTLTIGPGQMGQCHVANEYVELKTAAKCTLMLERLANTIA